MSLAKKLREVVAANFIEIARVDTPPTTPEPTPEAHPTTPIASAEAELDTFLKDIGAGTVASAEAATPEEVAPAVVEAPEPEAPAVIVEPVVEPVLPHLVDAVSDEGDVDFGRIFKQYELPQAAFTAEQAMSMLQALPRDLPLRTKRVTVNTTLSAIGAVVGATPKDIIADAQRKKENLTQYLDALGQEVEATTATLEAEIAQLQEQIAARREALRSASRKRTAAQDVCQSRMELFNQVVSFFDYDENALHQPEPAATEETEADPEDMPAFMREDAVRRMLGINEEEGEFDPVKFMEKYDTDEEATPPVEEAPESNRRGGRRRSPQRDTDELK